MGTWRDHFEQARKETGDATSIVAVAPFDEVLDLTFDDDFGSSAGPHVLIWTEDRVYFPVVYDGAEWIGSAPRHPRADGQRHVGGE